jgi:hypothetical protein
MASSWALRHAYDLVTCELKYERTRSTRSGMLPTDEADDFESDMFRTTHSRTDNGDNTGQEEQRRGRVRR